MTSQEETSLQRSGPEQGSQVAVTGTELDYPSIGGVLSGLSPPASLPRVGTATQDKEDLFQSLQEFVRTALLGGSPELRAGHIKSLDDVRPVLDDLWMSNTEYIARIVESLANGSRDPSWRAPYGRTGILEFFVRVIASEVTDSDLLLHSLRLVGNSCADTDENREIVVNGNYTLAIIRRILTPRLTHVVIPVIYNICIDFVPAQAQVAANKLTYILLNLIKDGAIQDEGLLNFSYELIELSVQGEHADRGISQSPSGTITLLMDLAVRDTSFSYFSSLVNCLTAYLERKRFQDIIIANRMVDRALAVLERSFSVEEGRSRENVKSLTQLQLKLNQTLADVSASPLFIEIYPLNSPLTQTLKSWLTAGEDQLQICACVMLGNLARSDEVCEEMVRDLGIHTQLVSALNSDTRAAVLHSVLGFLKNLAIASGNRQRLGDADIIPAVSRLWSFETVPQVQFSAVSIARQVIISSVENISRLLDPVSDSDQQTYLLLLLSAFEKTDSVPIRTEVGRIVTSICRTLSPKAREQDPQASALLDRLFSLHPTLTNPVGAMITQTQWPVVRSEGWFSLALMASNPLGCQSVVNCLQNPDFFQVLEGTLSKAEASTEKAEGLQIAKDRDNVVVFVQELLKNGPDSLPPDLKTKLGDLMDHASRHLKGTSGS